MVGSKVVTSTSSERSNGPFSFGGFADSAILRSSLAGFSGVIVNVEPSSPSKTRRGKRKPWMTRYDGRVFGSPSNETLAMAPSGCLQTKCPLSVLNNGEDCPWPGLRYSECSSSYTSVVSGVRYSPMSRFHSTGTGSGRGGTWSGPVCAARRVGRRKRVTLTERNGKSVRRLIISFFRSHVPAFLNHSSPLTTSTIFFSNGCISLSQYFHECVPGVSWYS